MITLDEAKQHLRLDTDHEDSYLMALIDTAVEYVEDDLDVTFAEMASIPLPVKQAVLFLTAFWFEQRTPVTNGNVVPREVPLTYNAIIGKYRNYSFPL